MRIILKRAVLEMFKVLIEAGATRTRLPPVELDILDEIHDYATETLTKHYSNEETIDTTHLIALIFLKDEPDGLMGFETYEEVQMIRDMYSGETAPHREPAPLGETKQQRSAPLEKQNSKGQLGL